MRTRPLEKRDFDVIVQVIDRWWGGPTTALAHPIFFYELGELAGIVEENDAMIGFLLGFASRPKGCATPVGYIHLLGTHPEHRRRGVGRLLYSAFEDECRRIGAVRLKAVTTTGNDALQRFHQRLGWDMSHVEDYAGPGRPRIVFTKELPPMHTQPEAPCRTNP